MIICERPAATPAFFVGLRATPGECPKTGLENPSKAGFDPGELLGRGLNMTVRDVLRASAGRVAVVGVAAVAIVIALCGPSAAQSGGVNAWDAVRGDANDAGALVQTDGALPSRRVFRRELAARGYDLVDVVAYSDRQAVVRVCSGGTLEELAFGPDYRARFVSAMGACDPAAPRLEIAPRFVPTDPDAEVSRAERRQARRDQRRAAARATLRDAGYADVRFLDQSGPTWVASGCVGAQEVEARIGRRGEIVDEVVVGGCGAGGSALEGAAAAAVARPWLETEVAAVRADLDALGYRRVFFVGRRGAGYLVDACHGVRGFRLRVTREGAVVGRQTDSFCRGDDLDLASLGGALVDADIIRGVGALAPSDCQTVLTWFRYNAPIAFETGSDQLTRGDLEKVRRIAENMRRCGPVTLRVEGHTDARGDRDANQNLSERRAAAVRRVLIQEGAPRHRVIANGFGEDHPIASNASAQGRALNRRIEFILEWGDA